MHIICLSSVSMTQVLVWRNPQANEQEWLSSNQPQENQQRCVAKAVAVEFALCICTIAAVAEAIIHSISLLVLFPLFPIVNVDFYKIPIKLLDSSLFTIIWGIYNAQAHLSSKHLFTRESFARNVIQQLLPPFIQRILPSFLNPCRPEDLSYIAHVNQQVREEKEFRQWVRQARQDAQALRPRAGQRELSVQAREDALERLRLFRRNKEVNIQLGATFLKEKVLFNADEATLSRFKEVDTEIYPFILSKAVYIYAAGSNRSQTIAPFFKPTTRQKIAALRRELTDVTILKQLEALFESFTTFSQDINTIKNQPLRSAFQKLCTLASEELQSSLLFTQCWQRAASSIDLLRN